MLLYLSALYGLLLCLASINISEIVRYLFMIWFLFIKYLLGLLIADYSLTLNYIIIDVMITMMLIPDSKPIYNMEMFHYIRIEK